jgi:hypothetical protein
MLVTGAQTDQQTGWRDRGDGGWEQIAPFFRAPAEIAQDTGDYSSLLKFYDGRPVERPEDWPARRREILDHWMSEMGPWPPLIAQPRMEVMEKIERENFLQSKVRIEIAPGQTGVGYLLVPPGAGPFPAMVVPYYEPESSIGLGNVGWRDFGYQLAKRGFVTLSIGSPGGDARQPTLKEAQCQPLSFLAYVAANCWNALANLPEVDSSRIGIVGHSYGGKWAMFAAALYDKFACGVWSDPGIVFDETRPNVNYWEPWYLGGDPERTRKPGLPTADNPRTGAYKRLVDGGHDLHEIQGLLAPRPFLVSGGAEDPAERWRALNQVVRVNTFMGATNRVAMTQRPGHAPTPESNEQIYAFLEYFLKQSPEDIIRETQRRAFEFFWNEADPQTGAIKDRAGNFGPDTHTVSSIAATGFGLAALPVAVERGWISRSEARDRAWMTLQFVLEQMKHQKGWLYHFIDMRTGERVWNCEISTIDTALFLAGALLAGNYFSGTEVEVMADALYRRTDFNWMRTDGGARPEEKLLSHGWRPESGFITHRWDNYSEHLILNLLALGSPTHAVPDESWTAWERNLGSYAGIETFACSPLFTHQYSQAFVDFRGKKDALGFDYFESGIQATLADRQFCIDQSVQHKTYGPNMWGLSATDGPFGYRAYGAPPGRVEHDGTIAPWSMLASIVYTPELCLESARILREQFGSKAWGRYGFSSGLNLDENWFSQEVIGIDLGAALLMIENHETGFVWNQFMSIPYIRSAMAKAGFNHRQE